MGMIKRREFGETGLTGEYWSIDGVFMSKSVMRASISLYRDKEAKMEGKARLSQEEHQYPISLEMFEEAGVNPYAVAYGLIKASNTIGVPDEETGELNEVELNFFADAVDDI